MGKAVALIYPTHGHITPALAVVEELVRRGEEVVFHATPRSRERVERTGARFHEYEGTDEEFNPDPPTDGLLSDMARLLALSERLLPGLLAHVQAEAPDYLLIDTKSVWGRLVGQVLGLRAITLSVVFAIEPGLVKVPDLVRWLYGGAPQDTLIAGLQQFGRYADTARRLAARYGHGPTAPDIIEFLGNPQPLTIVFTSREFQLQGDAFGDGFEFVGVSIAKSRDDAAPGTRNAAIPARAGVGTWTGNGSGNGSGSGTGAEAEAEAEGGAGAGTAAGAGAGAGVRAGAESTSNEDGEAPLVYVSLGTTFNNAPAFYQACFEAFDGLPCQALISTGGRELTLPNPPANITVRAYVPQLEVLQRASVFVTHGGMNSANEGLYFGVPLVVVPQRGDQHLVAARAADLGAGLAISPRDVTPDRLRDAVTRLLAEPTFTARARALGRSLEAAGGYVRAADVILARAS